MREIKVIIVLSICSIFSMGIGFYIADKQPCIDLPYSQYSKNFCVDETYPEGYYFIPRNKGDKIGTIVITKP